MPKSPTATLPLRGGQLLPLQGAVNFRDLGGYCTADGHCLKQGLVYRSDHLSRLTPEDITLLTHKHFKLVCDFRSVREERLAPDRLPQDGSIRKVHLPVEVSGFDPATVLDRIQAGDSQWLTMDFFVDLYQRYLDQFAPVWGKVLLYASDPGMHPMVFHCTGGKDRTGICATLLLMLLGVPEETIMADHDLSNVCNTPRLTPLYAKFASLGVERERIAPYLQAPAEPLSAMLKHLKHTYGSVEEYLLTKAGLKESTLHALRTNLLA